jgi:hypothetical protein
MSEVDLVNGLKFLLKSLDSVLGDLINRMEVENFFISHLIICSKTNLPS